MSRHNMICSVLVRHVTLNCVSIRYSVHCRSLILNEEDPKCSEYKMTWQFTGNAYAGKAKSTVTLHKISCEQLLKACISRWSSVSSERIWFLNPSKFQCNLHPRRGSLWFCCFPVYYMTVAIMLTLCRASGMYHITTTA